MEWKKNTIMNKCIWVDIDGTIGSCEHRRHHIDKTNPDKSWDKFYETCIDDPPHEDVIEIVKVLAAFYPVVICTGRPSNTREKTIEWLTKHNIPYTALYMRDEKDYRVDDVVKLEILDQLHSMGYEPLVALEVRNRVVKALRAAGVRVFHVVDGDY
jgi:hypothetical protein